MATKTTSRNPAGTTDRTTGRKNKFAGSVLTVPVAGPATVPHPAALAQQLNDRLAAGLSNQVSVGTHTAAPTLPLVSTSIPLVGNAVSASGPAAPVPAPISQRDAEIELLAVAWVNCKASAKKLYEEADGLEARIIELLGVGNSLRMTDSRTVRASDNFIDKNGNVKTKTVAIAMARRFEVEVK